MAQSANKNRTFEQDGLLRVVIVSGAQGEGSFNPNGVYREQEKLWPGHYKYFEQDASKRDYTWQDPERDWDAGTLERPSFVNEREDASLAFNDSCWELSRLPETEDGLSQALYRSNMCPRFEKDGGTMINDDYISDDKQISEHQTKEFFETWVKDSPPFGQWSLSEKSRAVHSDNKDARGEIAPCPLADGDNVGQQSAEGDWVWIIRAMDPVSTKFGAGPTLSWGQYSINQLVDAKIGDNGEWRRVKILGVDTESVDATSGRPSHWVVEKENGDHKNVAVGALRAAQ